MLIFLKEHLKKNEDNIIVRSTPNYATPLMRLITCIKFMESCIPIKDGFITEQKYNEDPIIIYIHNPYNNPIIYWNNEFISFIEYMIMNGMKISINFNQNKNYSYPSWISKLCETYKNQCKYYVNRIFESVYCGNANVYNVGLYGNIDLNSTIILYHKNKGQIITANDFILYNNEPVIYPNYFSI